VLDRWGIDYATVRQWNERIIYLSMSGVGQDGPWRDFVTYAPTIHALCGLTYLTNPPERKDVGMGFALTDHVSGLAGALAVLEVLEARRRIGHGQRIDLSQLEVGTYIIGPAYVDFLNNGREAQPVGNQDAFADYVPNNVYRCLNDEWLAITVRDDQEWQHLCSVIATQAFVDDRRFATVEGRRTHRAEVDTALGAWSAQQDAEQAMGQLQAAGVPAGKVQNMRDCTERDEQLAARQWLVEVENKLLGRHQFDGFPAIFSETPLGPYEPAPFFGEHNFEVYKELLGMSDEEIAAAIGEGLFA
jgi:crotonobetainyl-CoA:carnitine CoA-transferase CaiB-like acyl-CoA transferase